MEELGETLLSRQTVSRSALTGIAIKDYVATLTINCILSAVPAAYCRPCTAARQSTSYFQIKIICTLGYFISCHGCRNATKHLTIAGSTKRLQSRFTKTDFLRLEQTFAGKSGSECLFMFPAYIFFTIVDLERIKADKSI